MSASSASQRVVIVGGGISGLSIAVRLCQAGLPVTLLEASQLGFAASTRNQGWLHSGAWFAPQHQALAAQCYRSLLQTLSFCPDCVEPNHSGMYYLVTNLDDDVTQWTSAWTGAGIPFEPMELHTILDVLPHWSLRKLEHAWRLPDRAIRTDILLKRLMQVAEDHGAEIRTGAPVAGLMRTQDQIHGVITASGEELTAGLVILATGGEPGLWSEVSTEQPGVQPSYQLVNLKTHLLAIRPGLSSQPFCVLDHQGLNHIPHGSTSVIGSNHWTIASKFDDVLVEHNEITRTREMIRELLPSWDFSQSEIVEWAGTTVQAMHVEQVQPGCATLPTVIDHESEPGGLRNLISVFPGRASLWPQLSEKVLEAVKEKREIRIPPMASPPWVTRGAV